MSSSAAANGRIVLRGLAEALRHGQAEHGADALAAGQQRVAHGRDERPGGRRGAEVELLEVVSASWRSLSG